MSKKPNIDPHSVREEILKAYPPKVARKRAKQMIVNEWEKPGECPSIQANVRTTPGIITQRGCCYAGCKGVVLGPTRDILNLTHGPIGCGFYSWLTRRNQTRPPTDKDHNFMTYCFSTDMQDSEIIFGGEKKLAQALQEAYDNFKPKAIGIFSTCPVGLIGDDIHQVATQMRGKLGINIFGFSCEGYKGVSQSAGHHIANNQLFKHVIGLDDEAPKGKYRINLLGEYNIGGDAFIIEELLEKCGITLVSTFSGNSSYDGFTKAHTSDLNCVMCHRSINYVADMIEKKFGVPWIKVNFISAAQSADSLRNIAAYFGDKKLMDQVEKVIKEEMKAVLEAQEAAKVHCEGKLAMIFVGGSRAHHYQDLFREMGMTTMAAGYEFAHRDDYEGRRILPSIKLDADSRNIEELTVEPDAERYKPRKTQEEIDALAKDGMPFTEYTGMIPDMPQGTFSIDDISHHEMEKMIEVYQPAVFCAGIKEKYCIQKLGVPSKQLHSYDYGGPFAAFKGAINFYEEINRLVHCQVWKMLTPPWRQTVAPSLDAEFVKS